MRRRIAAALLALAAWLAPLSSPAQAADLAGMRKALAAQLRPAGAYSGALVVDLDTDEELYAVRPDVQRIPASVEKLYTTTTALLRLRASGKLRTEVLAGEPIGISGILDGDLYLRGGGDPTLTLPELDRLAVDLVAETGLTKVTGSVLGDESAFDALRGVPSSRYHTSAYVGPLGALVVNRGRTGRARPYWQDSPADWAADAFVRSLRRAGVKIPKTVGRPGLTAPGALPLAGLDSPPMSALIRLANVPSDNFIAETLLKAIGAAGGEVGTTARGASIVRRAMVGVGLRPRVADGSGLSRANRTTPRDVIRLLGEMYGDEVFEDSLAVAGRSGTLEERMRRSFARGRCQGKTGSLVSVSNVAGYCRTAGGDTLAFAILMNGVNPYAARTLQDRMIGAIARYES